MSGIQRAGKGQQNRNPHPCWNRALIHAISISGILHVVDNIEIANRFLCPTHTARDFALPSLLRENRNRDVDPLAVCPIHKGSFGGQFSPAIVELWRSQTDGDTCVTAMRSYKSCRGVQLNAPTVGSIVYRYRLNEDPHYVRVEGIMDNSVCLVTPSSLSTVLSPLTFHFTSTIRPVMVPWSEINL